MSERRGDDNVSGIAPTLAEAAPAPTARVERVGPESPTHREQPFDSAGPTMAAPFDSVGATMAAPFDSAGPTMPPDDGNATHRESPGARASQPTLRPPRPSLKDMRYVVGEEIARGGMGRVVAANDTLLGRVVAIKEALIVDGDLKERFIRETKITARLEHPSIVPVYDAGTKPDGSPFYVMRRVTGQPLDKLVHDATTLDQRLALLPNLLAAANAIAHAHGRGTVHRDIKPSNILVGELGETVVIDWGLAKVIDEADEETVAPMRSIVEEDSIKTRVGSVVGTPGFMPPEQLRGERVDARTDVYALGATLYFLLARRPPHAAKTGHEMISAALAGPPTPVRELVAGVPSELLTIVDKALAYRHADRYHDAGGLAADLDRFLRGQLVASHRYSRRERLVRWWRRHRLAISISVVAAAVLAIGGALSVSRIIEARRRADIALSDALLRNEQLQLAHARGLIRNSPREALELIRPLAPKYWQEARSVALAARAAGIAKSLPASTYTISVSLARDGTHALVAGDDGVLRIFDVAARTSREVTRLGQSMQARYADGDTAIIVWGGGKVARIAPADGARTELFDADVASMAVDDTTLWWADSKGQVWTRRLDESAARPINVSDRITTLAVQGGVAALGGATQLWIVRDGVARAVAPGAVTSLAWMSNGKVAAVVDRYPFEVDPETSTVARLGDLQALEVFALSGGGVFVRGVSNLLTIYDRGTRFELPPTAALNAFGASPQSEYLIGGADGQVLVWDLRQLRPRVQPLAAATDGANWKHDQIVVQLANKTVVWIDLVSGAMTTYPVAVRFQAAGIDPTRQRLVVCETDDRAVLYRRAGGDPVTIDPCHVAWWVGDTVFLGSKTGEIHAYDTVAGRSKLLYRGTSPVWSFYGRGDWVGAVFDDNASWRMNVHTGESTTLLPAPDRTMALRDNGDAVLTDSAGARIWRRDGTVVPGPSVPGPVRSARPIDDRYVVLEARSETGYLVDLATGTTTQIYPPGSRLHDLVYAGDLGVYIGGDDSLHLTTPFTGDTWLAATPWRFPLRAPIVLTDHSALFAVAGDVLLTWPIPVVTTREQTLQLIDELIE